MFMSVHDVVALIGTKVDLHIVSLIPVDWSCLQDGIGSFVTVMTLDPAND